MNTIKKATIAALALAALGLTAPAEAQHPWVLWGQQHYKWKAERPRILQIFDSRKECEKAESRAFWKEHGVTNESASPQEHVNKAEKHRKWVEETGIYTDYSCLPVGVDPR